VELRIQIGSDKKKASVSLNRSTYVMTMLCGFFEVQIKSV